ncbi:MAG: hypothetical protein K9N09_06920 [Candidatus Cloacimonetes bacterium]|nr:hypothetical protein [Candidatus Cloacimonadota bacterium]MCF7815221.1 hypothetical protein [Candidatus Cloacimonadota bacterium]MCF7868416.1 hypothetical protein [Candidatus Cloacimonadota bacterium]MCF7883889.1 hypothetical protein [Candidatus Cloacimonadota bacterium]
MLISVDNSWIKNAEKKIVDKQKVKNNESTNYPLEHKTDNPLERNKINRLEKTYNHIHTAYDKY